MADKIELEASLAMLRFKKEQRIADFKKADPVEYAKDISALEKSINDTQTEIDK